METGGQDGGCPDLLEERARGAFRMDNELDKQPDQLSSGGKPLPKKKNSQSVKRAGCSRGFGIKNGDSGAPQWNSMNSSRKRDEVGRSRNSWHLLEGRAHEEPLATRGGSRMMASLPSHAIANAAKSKEAWHVLSPIRQRSRQLRQRATAATERLLN